MKKLDRYTCDVTTAAVMVRLGAGAWVLYEDAMEALNERQAAADVAFAEKERLLRCVELGDRMRALMADHLLRNAKVLTWNDVHEVTDVAQLWDDARKTTFLTPWGERKAATPGDPANVIVPRDTVRTPKE
jgi:hypothetical protein